MIKFDISGVITHKLFIVIRIRAMLIEIIKIDMEFIIIERFNDY